MKTLKGTYNGDLEISEFVTSGTKERFHLNRGFVESLPKGEFQLRAWVSPETELGFGHFNQWKREIIVTEILDSKKTD